MSGTPRGVRSTVLAALPLILSALLCLFGVCFAWGRHRDFRSAGVETSEAVPAPLSKGEIQIRVAGDSWPGYAAFRASPTLTAALARDGYELRYVSNETHNVPRARLQALLSGEIDVALVPLASLVQFVVSAPEVPEPGALLAVQFVVDESTGGDVLLVNRNVERLSLLSRVDTCVALDGASDAFRRFAFDALPGILSPAKSAASLSFQGNCLEQIRQDKVQLAALRNPHAALARSEGQRVLFTSWQVGAHLNFDVAVSRRDLDPLQRRAIRALAGAYFASVTHWRTEPENAARTLQNDCATLCEKDPSLGGQFLADMKLFNLQDNGCVWFGACREGGSLREAVQELSALFAHDKQQGGPELRFPLEELFDASTLLNLAREAGMDFGATKAALGLAPGASGATPGAAELDVQTPSVAVLHYKVLHEVPRLAKTAVDVDAESTVKLPKLEFAAGSFQLDFAAQTQLKQWSRVLWRFPGVCFRVIGYSTFKEEPEPDFRLSRVRAQAVASELTRLRPDAFPETRFELVAKRAAVGVVNARSVEMGVLPCKVW